MLPKPFRFKIKFQDGQELDCNYVATFVDNNTVNVTWKDKEGDSGQTDMPVKDVREHLEAGRWIIID